jgi:hypothetical protein
MKGGPEDRPIVTTTAPKIVFSATDPFGVEVYMTGDTLEAKSYHPEIDDFDGHRDAVEDPALVAHHVESSDRRIYLSHAWDPSDPAYAPLLRMIVAAVDSTGSRAKIITAYNHTATALPTTLGTPVVFNDDTLPKKR